ncbi:hypothetical protein HOC80_02830 [archaeon]|jgi:hypothetical protein|nr:hypothetical protein [archaeon]MBT4417016.1 hypothetical protein [archaeon]
MKGRYILGLATVGLVGLIGALSTPVYRDHNPSYYAITDNREEGSNLQAGEKDYDVWIQQGTVDEIRSQFKFDYRLKNGESALKPNRRRESNVTEEDIINFTVDYIGDKLNFRWPVLFPQPIVDGIRKAPFGMSVMPKKQNEYFQNTTQIDVEGEWDILTDCWDYSQLFKNAFNVLAQDYGVEAEAFRVTGDTYFNLFGLDKKVGDHDFNLVIDSEGNHIYIDTNGPDTLWITNPPNITDKVVVREEK